ncbi:MAG: pilus assembly PilX N-terminal domain-containing protein [Kiritimatiellae bacterium]|nr:pilus assembly PilX N-terminal domain-containing protein [Kiritimatiellia bacterium]
MTTAAADRRRGIALVIVLGLMAMLAILGISFATTMRTEHRAARMGGDNLGAIEMTYYGLAEALYHIDRDSESAQWVAPNWTKYTIHSGQNSYHPDRQGSGLNDMLVGYGVWFTPSAIVGGPAGGGARDETNNVRWIRVKSPEGQVIGQFCYMLIDVSGFLDPNGNYSMVPELARSQPRMFGTNVTELALTNPILRELRTGRERFIYDGRIGTPRRKPYGRIETLADMRPALAWQDLWEGTAPMLNIIATNFFPFSYFLPGYADAATREAKPQTDLRGGGAELAARINEIRAACQGILPSSEVDMFVNNLIDYVDSDYVPGGLEETIKPGENNADSFCTEPVPMLNELQIGCVYQASGTKYLLRFRIHTELFFPFLFTSNSIASAPPSPIQLRFRGRLEGGTFEPKTFNEVMTIGWNPNWWVRNHATAAADPTSPQITTYAMNLTMSADNTNAVAPERFVIEDWSVTLPNGVVLDRLSPAAGGVVASLPMDEYLSRNINSPQAFYCGWECNDPRINWLLGNTTHWPYSYKARALSNPFDPDATTLNRINRLAAKEQGEWVMYVSNGPLYSIGELGYLLFHRNRPWTTISFFPAAGGSVAIMPVLDRFTLFPYPRHGLVNINTRITNVLATAFHMCPVELAPGIRLSGSAGNPVNPAEAMELAGWIVSRRPSVGFINMSDIRNVPELGTAVPRITSWLAREGLIRNTHGLLGIRQNLIMALIAGQSLEQFTDPESGSTSVTRLAGHRAFATIWRDPYKENIGGQLMHRTFVRNFRWYDEWVGTGEIVEPGLP